MAVQGRLKSLKSKSPKVVVENYQDVFDTLVVEVKDPGQLQQEVEAYLTAGEVALLILRIIDGILLLYCKSGG